MARIYNIRPIHVVQVPKEMEEGVLYISNEFGLAIHLCACGCGRQAVTPLNGYRGRTSGWTLVENDGNLTLRPSIGNFSGESPYHAHYYITNNTIEWL